METPKWHQTHAIVPGHWFLKKERLPIMENRLFSDVCGKSSCLCEHMTRIDEEKNVP